MIVEKEFEDVWLFMKKRMLKSMNFWKLPKHIAFGDENQGGRPNQGCNQR